MTCGTEPGNVSNDYGFIEQLSRLETADALTEVSIAALTTEPELMNIGRALISLARYHASKKAQPVMSRGYR
jgi:hypothetical protein